MNIESCEYVANDFEDSCALNEFIFCDLGLSGDDQLLLKNIHVNESFYEYPNFGDLENIKSDVAKLLSKMGNDDLVSNRIAVSVQWVIPNLSGVACGACVYGA